MERASTAPHGRFVCPGPRDCFLQSQRFRVAPDRRSALHEDVSQGADARSPGAQEQPGLPSERAETPQGRQWTGLLLRGMRSPSLPASPVEAWWPGQRVLRSFPTSQHGPGHTHLGVRWPRSPHPIPTVYQDGSWRRVAGGQRCNYNRPVCRNGLGLLPGRWESPTARP